MAKYLVIVESPAKVKTIKKFLGSNYEVVASQGHVRDMPKSQLGFDPNNGFELIFNESGFLLVKIALNSISGLSLIAFSTPLPKLPYPKIPIFVIMFSFTLIVNITLFGIFVKIILKIILKD